MEARITSAHFPVGATWTPTGLDISFRNIHPVSFVDPFSHETITRLSGAAAEIRKFSWEQISRYREPGSGRTPKGIILHPARAGSTLIVACLKGIPSPVTYSEPLVICDVLNPAQSTQSSSVDHETHVAALRLVVDLLGCHACNDFVLKLRSWNTLFADLIFAAFPSAPWVFVVRDPLEIGVSIRCKPPTWMRARECVPNPFAQYVARPDSKSAERYFAHMFSSFCGAICRAKSSQGQLIRYETLPDAVWESLCPHFGIAVTELDIAKMRAISRFDSKSTFGQPRLFVPDSDRKRAAASPVLCAAVDEIARPSLRQLEKHFELKAHLNERRYHLAYESRTRCSSDRDR